MVTLRFLWLPIAVFFLCFWGYLLTLCPTVYVEGSGELIGASYLLGTAHPTGYPLFCLAGRLFAAIMPWGNPAYKINLFTAFSSACATGALSLFLRYVGCRTWVAGITAVTFGFSATFWSQAVIAEVYGLSLLAAVLTMGFGLVAATTQDRRFLLLLGWIMGLGLTCHLNQILVWPGVFFVLWWKWPGLRRLSWLQVYFLSCLVGAYSIVFYLFVRNGLGPGFHWGYLGQAGLMWEHISGGLYRTSFFSLPLEGMWLNAQRWGVQLLSEFHPLLIPVALWGGWRGWQRDKAASIVVGGASIANLLLAFNYQRDPNGLGVFFLLSFLGMAILLGFALEDLLERLSRPIIGVLLVCLIPVGVIANNYSHADRSGVWTAHTYGTDILAALPYGAMLISEGDDASYCIDYLQRIEGKRPDLRLINRIGRGKDILSKEDQHLALPLQYKKRRQYERELLNQATFPIYYLYARAMLSKDHVFVPAGLVYRVWPKNKTLPDSLGPQIPMENALIEKGKSDPWIRKIQSNYWFMQGENLLAKGKNKEGQKAFYQAAKLAYDSRTMLFNVAIKLLEVKDLEGAWKYGQQARDRDPFKAQTYKLLAHIAKSQGKLDVVRELLKRAQELGVKP